MIGWFLAPYKRRAGEGQPTRYCAMDDFTPQIVADGGGWSEAETLGNQAVVKVVASQATLDAIAATPGFMAVPRKWARLVDSLVSMTNGERNLIQSRLLQLGYTQAEINAVMGSSLTAWRTKTLEQLLGLFASKRLKPRYDQAQDAIVLDGPVQPTRPIRDVDVAVGV
jgi:hypothetical protein